MGAGKSYTMRNLVDRGRFPLLAFVKVDPDEIRRQLPEYHLYVTDSPELAGELTNKEAGFIAEILTLAGLEKGKVRKATPVHFLSRFFRTTHSPLSVISAECSGRWVLKGFGLVSAIFQTSPKGVSSCPNCYSPGIGPS